MVLHTAGDTLKAAGGLGQFIASESSAERIIMFHH
jgi:hypothetical protein